MYYDPTWILDYKAPTVADKTPNIGPVLNLDILDDVRLRPRNTMEQAAIEMTRPQQSVLTDAPQGMTEPQTTTTNPKQMGYEDYLKIFKETLGNAPQLDERKRKQLAAVAAINAIGQALRTAVNMYGAKKYDAPITSTVDPTTLQLLGQYQDLEDEYKKRKDIYDQRMANAMQQAFQYAYGDEKARQDYLNQLDLLNRRQTYESEQEKQRRLFATQEREAAQAYQTNRDAIEDKAAIDRINAQYDKESRLIELRKQADMDMLKAKYGEEAFNKASEIGNKDDFPVIDPQTGKEVLLPKSIYWDVLTKELQRMNKDFGEFITSADFNASNNSANAIVTGAWRDYWEPHYNASGALVGFKPRGGSPSKGASWLQGDADSNKTQQHIPTYFQ